MSNNDVLKILAQYQDKWIAITDKLLFTDSNLKANDIVQDMYIKVFDDLTNNLIDVDNLIVNNKPHFGIIKNILNRIIINKSNNKRNYLELNELYKELPDTNEPINNIDAKIDEVLADMYWFDRKLFNLYRNKFHSIRKLSKATKISHVTVYQTISRCKKELKKKVKL